MKIKMEKEKDWTPNDLRGKTVYDFCDDEALLEQVINMPQPLHPSTQAAVMDLQPYIQSDMIADLATRMGRWKLAEAARVLTHMLENEYDRQYATSEP